PDGDPLRPILVDPPAHGTVSIRSDGLIVYEPRPHSTGPLGEPIPPSTGPDGFTYRASDSDLESSLASVFITVEPVPLQAVVTDDVFSRPYDGLHHVFDTGAPGTTANDFIPDDRSLLYVVITQPRVGYVSIDQFHREFLFHYNPGFLGTVTFTYGVAQ